uniref:hypothetical protein n=1 Tax=Ruminococcus bromii TaxID=40518 RepID=UPI003FEF6385
RPRVGMGWFFFQSARKHQDVSFSSPLGDGLVRVCSYHSLLFEFIFVPAWGWVGSYSLVDKLPDDLKDFRPRVGMGWFKNTEHHTVTANIFVPTWGWDGSILKKQLKLSKGDFRPRVGMGWFGR